MTERTDRQKRIGKIVMAAFILSGAAALIYEVVWIRSLSLVMGSTTYAVSTMLSSFMTGLALGAFLGGKLGDRVKNTVLVFGICELGIGVFGLLTVPVINSLTPLYFTIFNKYHLEPDTYFAVQFVLCFAIMLVPTALMGATFPLVTKIAAGSEKSISSDVGKVYSVNTVGAIIGSFSAGFILIPLIGLKMTTQAAAGLNLIVGLIMVFLSGERKAPTIAGAGIILCAAMNFAAVQSHNNGNQYNFYTARRFPTYEWFLECARNYKVVFERDDPHGTVRVFEDINDHSLSLQIGGKNEGSFGVDDENTLLLAYLPLAARPGAKSFLGIGLGTGITMRAAKSKVADVDWVEINPAVITAVKKYFNPGLMGPDNRVIINDARTYIKFTNKKYDIISSEPSYPTEAVTANLFTKEFFESASRIMNDGGVFCQWIPFYLFNDRELEIMFKTFTSVFPYASLWGVKADMLLIGSKQQFQPTDMEIYNRVNAMNDSTIQLHLAQVRNSGQITKTVQNSEELPINTDDRPSLEFTVARTMLTGKAL